MLRVLRTMLDTIGGTLALLLIDVISFCLALRLFITQSLSEAPNKKMMVAAAVLSIVATCVTNKLLSSKKPVHIANYAKDEGFDDDETLGLSADSINFEAKDDSYYKEDFDSDEDYDEDYDIGEEEEEVRYHVSNIDVHNQILDKVKSSDTSDCEGDVNHLLEGSSNNINKPHTRAFELDSDVSLDFDSGESLRGFEKTEE